MLISVIVPTRNRPTQLRLAVTAIARQTHAPLELIVVDDGSTPENAAANRSLLETILAAWQAPAARQWRYVFLESGSRAGSGPSGARNAGLEVAQGELVAFCDDDDEWCDPHHLEAAARQMADITSVDLVFGNQHTLVEGKVVSDQWLPLLAERLRLDDRPRGAFVELSASDCLIDHFPSMNLCVFRRSLLAAIEGFWEGVRYSEDMDLYVRAVENAHSVYYRHETVCLHHVPDPSKRASASTRLSQRDKDLALTAIGNHLQETCRSRAAQRYARRVAGYAYRRLARAALAESNRRGAYGLARLGLAAWPTLRWAAFTAWIGLTK